MSAELLLGFWMIGVACGYFICLFQARRAERKRELQDVHDNGMTCNACRGAGTVCSQCNRGGSCNCPDKWGCGAIPAKLCWKCGGCGLVYDVEE